MYCCEKVIWQMRGLLWRGVFHKAYYDITVYPSRLDLFNSGRSSLYSSDEPNLACLSKGRNRCLLMWLLYVTANWKLKDVVSARVFIADQVRLQHVEDARGTASSLSILSRLLPSSHACRPYRHAYTRKGIDWLGSRRGRGMLIAYKSVLFVRIGEILQVPFLVDNYGGRWLVKLFFPGVSLIKCLSLKLRWWK